VEIYLDAARGKTSFDNSKCRFLPSARPVCPKQRDFSKACPSSKAINGWIGANHVHLQKIVG
jgi:hypothetical protein